MTQQAVSLEVECANCASPCTEWLVQEAQDGRLRWETEWQCEQCGMIAEDGDWGRAPEKVRNSIIEQFGRYSIRLKGPQGAAGGRVMKVVRDTLGTSIPESAIALDEMRGSGYSATLVEVSLIAEVLDQAGIETFLESGAQDQN